MLGKNRSSSREKFPRANFYKGELSKGEIFQGRNFPRYGKFLKIIFYYQARANEHGVDFYFLNKKIFLPAVVFNSLAVGTKFNTTGGREISLTVGTKFNATGGREVSLAVVPHN
jgi:hypothetical protein